MLGGSEHVIKKNTVALLISRKNIRLEINADKTKCMFMSGRCLITKTDNAFERVEHFEYLETTLTNQNSIQAEIKSRVKKGNSCRHSVQNLLSFSLLSKNIKI